MNIYTFKLSKKTILLILLAVLALIALLILLVPDRAARTSGGIRSDADCVAYIERLGYAVRSEPLSDRRVTIPETFDETYLQYNELQKCCGFDLSDYCGREVTLRTFAVTNYPNEPDVLVDLLICRNQVIGGAVYTTALDGFMHGLQPLDSSF